MTVVCDPFGAVFGDARGDRRLAALLAPQASAVGRAYAESLLQGAFENRWRPLLEVLCGGEHLRGRAPGLDELYEKTVLALLARSDVRRRAQLTPLIAALGFGPAEDPACVVAVKDAVATVHVVSDATGPADPKMTACGVVLSDYRTAFAGEWVDATDAAHAHEPTRLRRCRACADAAPDMVVSSGAELWIPPVLMEVMRGQLRRVVEAGDPTRAADLLKSCDADYLGAWECEFAARYADDLGLLARLVGTRNWLKLQTAARKSAAWEQLPTDHIAGFVRATAFNGITEAWLKAGDDAAFTHEVRAREFAAGHVRERLTEALRT